MIRPTTLLSHRPKITARLSALNCKQLSSGKVCYPQLTWPFFDGSIISLPRLRVSGEIYSVDFSVVDGETIFLSNYQALTKERSFPLSTSITSRHGHGEKWGFEGTMVNVLQGGTSPLLVKSFLSMSVCTDEDSIGCYKQPSISL